MFGLFKSQNRPVSKPDSTKSSSGRSGPPLSESQSRTVSKVEIPKSPRAGKPFIGEFGEDEEDEDDVEDDDKSATLSQVGSSTFVEDEEFIKNGNKGIIVFGNIYCVKTCRHKTFHLHITSGHLIQYTNKSRKKFLCSDVHEIKKNSSNQVIVKIKHSLDISSKKKKYCFDSDEAFYKFRKYIYFINETGPNIKEAFESIDSKGLKHINKSNLKAAMLANDLDATDAEIKAMLSINDGNGQNFQYDDFFHVFFQLEVNNLRECLMAWLHQAKIALKTNQMIIQQKPEETQINLLPGEEVKHFIEKSRWVIHAGGKIKDLSTFGGKLYVTNYRLCLISFLVNRGYRHSIFDIPPFFDRLSIPLSTIQKIQIVEKKILMIQTKDNRTIRIQLFVSVEDVSVETLISRIYKEAFIENKSDTLRSIAFAYKFRGNYGTNGWQFSEIRREYARQGLDDTSVWKMVDNSDFALIETYPRWLIVPARLDYEVLLKSIHHRAKNRFPAITYRHPNGALMSRSAQPISGILNACKEDETLLNLYRVKGKPDDPSERDSKYYIYDARRQIAATLNRAAGKGGTENAAAYKNTELIYCNIDNIHVMRASYDSLGEVLSPGTVIEAMQSDTGGGSGFHQKIEESGWLRHIRLILVACLKMGEKIHLEGSSLLVHCSDGWDRTAQLCSLTQVMIDPYFRTLEGIATLIEKEWCAFGFKFNDRCGHCHDYNHKPDERSPVFVQFLDCLSQIMNQFPNTFEYNEHLLVFLGDHQHSCLFGTFIGNYEKMKTDLKVREETISIWSYVFENKEEFINNDYKSFLFPIWPCCSIAKIKLWDRYYLRWDPESHPNSLSGKEWHDNWGPGLETYVFREVNKELTPPYAYRAPLPLTKKGESSKFSSSISASRSFRMASSDPSTPTSTSTPRSKTPVSVHVNTSAKQDEFEEFSNFSSPIHTIGSRKNSESTSPRLGGVNPVVNSPSFGKPNQNPLLASRERGASNSPLFQSGRGINNSGTGPPAIPPPPPPPQNSSNSQKSVVTTDQVMELLDRPSEVVSTPNSRIALPGLGISNNSNHSNSSNNVLNGLRSSGMTSPVSPRNSNNMSPRNSNNLTGSPMSPQTPQPNGYAPGVFSSGQIPVVTAVRRKPNVVSQSELPVATPVSDNNDNENIAPKQEQKSI